MSHSTFCAWSEKRGVEAVAIDGRSEKTRGDASKQAIVQALLDLMRTDAYAKITVTQIVQRAGLARLTFYRHFETKEGALRWHLDGLFAAYRAEYQRLGETELVELLVLCFEYWRKNDEMLKLLHAQGLQSLLFEPFSAYTHEILDMQGIRQLSSFQIGFLSGGLFEAMMQWIEQAEPLASARQAAKDVLDLLVFA